MRCGIQEKGQPQCQEELYIRQRDKELLCPVHCRAKTNRGPCKKRHKKGAVRCFKHGGNSRRGLNHPGLKDGARANPLYLGILRPEGARAEPKALKTCARKSLETIS
jgi:hypothetical protein